MPAKGALAKWRDQVSTDFRFVLKAPQRITHHSKLTDTDSLAYLLDAADTELGGALGAYLFQLPPFLRKDVPRLRDFLARYRPAARRRSSSATSPGSTTRSTPRCATAAPRSASPRAARRSTRRSSRPRAGATCGCGARTTTTPTLERWVARLREAPWSRAFVFFKHEDAGAGPRLAARFRELFGEG